MAKRFIVDGWVLVQGHFGFSFQPMQFVASLFRVAAVRPSVAHANGGTGEIDPAVPTAKKQSLLAVAC